MSVQDHEEEAAVEYEEGIDEAEGMPAAHPQYTEYPNPTAAFDPSAFMTSGDNGAMIGQDEAFSRALNAMYWGGYWTAVYHVRPFLLIPCSL